MIVVSPVFALAAIVFSMFGAKVAEVVEPFDAPERMREAKNLSDIGCDEFPRQHIIDYYRAQLDYWRTAIEDIRKVVATKAQRVLCGQAFLIAALAILVLVFIVFLLAQPAPSSPNKIG